MKIEVMSWITGLVRLSVEASSLKLALEGAVEQREDLTGADLRDAVLTGAVLTGADLRDADLTGANLRGADGIIQGGSVNGWLTYAVHDDQGLTIQIGCRRFSLLDARAYWTGKPNRREIVAFLDYAERLATLRGWITPEASPSAMGDAASVVTP